MVVVVGGTVVVGSVVVVVGTAVVEGADVVVVTFGSPIRSLLTV